MLLYPLNFAASSPLKYHKGIIDSLSMIQRMTIDEDTHKIKEGVPFISIVDLSIHLNGVANIDPIESVNNILIAIRRFILLTYNKPNRDAVDALRWIFSQDKKLALWCACQVARKALRFLPPGERRPLRLIEATEGLVREQVSSEDVRKAANNIVMLRSESASATYYVAYAASGFHNDSFSNIRNCVYAVAAAYADASYVENMTIDALTETRDRALLRLVSVIADAILTFPV